MNIFLFGIVICWAVFLLVWGISAFGVKKDAGPKNILQRGRVGLLVRIAAACVIAWTVWQRATGQFTSPPAAHHPLSGALWGIDAPLWGIGMPAAATNPALGAVAFLCCAIGTGFAVWARMHLGRNWSARPTTKVGHELVTTGPYAFVRHPIYTGIILSAFGSALAVGLAWFIPFAVMLVLYLSRIPREERLMTELFPDQYPAYKERTKALIPFVW
jgi:protein-S-isoprenylcysteine O-methyltransferase Ste14